MPDHYDAIIIGAGQGGMPLSRALAAAGWKTALVERKHVGGTCINEGCTPTKTMVASGRVAYLAHRAAEYGVSTHDVAVSMEVVRARKRAIVDSFRAGNEQRIQQAANLDFFFGEARFTGVRALEVALNDGGTKQMSADKVIVNTGARPYRPPIDGLDSIDALDSTSIMELDTVPQHLIILGGGYIGLEFGQMFRRFGSDVTVIDHNPRLASREDPDICAALWDIMNGDGLSILLSTETRHVYPSDDGVCVEVQTPNGSQTLWGSHVLVATGRTPNTDRLNLSVSGIETDARGYIRANERLETTCEGVYAIGDVKGGPAFTHLSYDDFRILRANLLDGGNATSTGRLIPYTVFTDPQLGRVGLTETEARAQGYNVLVGKLPMNYVARALEMDESRGLLKAVVDADTGHILGCAMLGIEGGELMAMVQIAMMGKLHYTALRDAIFAHPTLAESLNNLFASLA